MPPAQTLEVDLDLSPRQPHPHRHHRIARDSLLALAGLLVFARAPGVIAAPSPAGVSASGTPSEDQTLAHEILRELIETDTTHDHGSTTTAAEALARRFRAAGFPAADVQVLGPSPRKMNLVVRLRARPSAGGAGAGVEGAVAGGTRDGPVVGAPSAAVATTRKPILLLGHLDVVAAERADWSLDPFALTEKDGFYYGRGTLDMKSLVTLWVADLLRLHRTGEPTSRDLILALTADEEDGDENGVEWLLAHGRPLIDAEFALNEGGGGEISHGHYRANDVQCSEKGYQSYRLEVRNKGGHSSLPEPDNAIVRLSAGLVRLHAHRFPAQRNPVTRAYFQRVATFETGQLGADLRAIALAPEGRPLDPGAVGRLSALPFYNARLRTTCVPTRVTAGHADNALPQLASAVVNCRLLPGETPAHVEQVLRGVIADSQVSVKAISSMTTTAPTLPPAKLLAIIEKVTSRFWPGVPVLPTMSAGATDGRFLRAAGIPTYGVSGLFHEVDDNRAHGRDERLAIRSFVDGQAFTYALLQALVAN
jgi:acetylornithine deacetylase/succinyl-diaminopimelate desuccinylase-like protein